MSMLIGGDEAIPACDGLAAAAAAAACTGADFVGEVSAKGLDTDRHKGEPTMGEAAAAAAAAAAEEGNPVSGGAAHI